MEYKIEKVEERNYSLFEDMLFWRENGSERKPSGSPVTQVIKQELENPNLFVYAALVDCRYVGWISLVYMPKVGKWKGHGHIYVDELWIEPGYRRQGIAKALMQKADELKVEMNAVGIRLYVNVHNPGAQRLYENCGYKEDGQAYFMEKY